MVLGVEGVAHLQAVVEVEAFPPVEVAHLEAVAEAAAVVQEDNFFKKGDI